VSTEITWTSPTTLEFHVNGKTIPFDEAATRELLDRMRAFPEPAASELAAKIQARRPAA
jgi:hypothetical protein